MKLLSHHLRNSPATKLGKELIKDVKKQIEEKQSVKDTLLEFPVLITSTKSRAMLTGNEIYKTRNQRKPYYIFRTDLLNEFFLVEELNPILKENILKKQNYYLNVFSLFYISKWTFLIGNNLNILK